MAQQTILERDLKWLRELHDDLWKEVWESHRFGGGFVKQELPHRLTDDDFARVRAIIDTHRLPVRMTNTRFGFGVGMVIHEPERAWLYPGVEEESTPEVITMISQSHLPPSESTSGCDNKRTTFDDGWRVFEPMTHAEPNVALLERCGFKAPKDKGHYVY